jgi:methyl-accepting chemotaxis protein
MLVLNEAIEAAKAGDLSRILDAIAEELRKY